MGIKSEIKLNYFNFKGLGECSRFLLSYADVEFVDNRVDANKDWEKIKKDQPFHQFPTLEAEGHVITESLAQWRYLANRFNLVLGTTFIQKTLEDSLFHHISDFYEILKEMQKSGELKKYEDEIVPFYLSRFESRVKDHGNFFYDKISWVEIVLAAIVDIVESKGRLNKSILEDYPKLKTLNEKVRSKPSLKAYIDRRPVTDI